MFLHLYHTTYDIIKIWGLQLKKITHIVVTKNEILYQRLVKGYWISQLECKELYVVNFS